MFGCVFCFIGKILLMLLQVKQVALLAVSCSVLYYSVYFVMLAIHSFIY